MRRHLRSACAWGETNGCMNRLSEIFAHKRLEVAARESALPLDEVRAAAESAAPALDFVAALRGARRPALIAEVKAASPARGALARRGGGGRMTVQGLADLPV